MTTEPTKPCFLELSEPTRPCECGKLMILRYNGWWCKCGKSLQTLDYCRINDSNTERWEAANAD